MIHENKILIIIFGVSLLTGYIFLGLSWDYQQQHDALTFIRGAQNIVSGGLGNCNMDKEPGYSVLLFPLFRLFSNFTAIILARVMNIILFALTSILFYLTLKMLLYRYSPRIVLFFSLLFSISPQLASFSALCVYSETLQLFLNSVILFCLVSIFYREGNFSGRLKFYIIAGLAASCLTITKTFFMLYALWMVFFILIHCTFFNKTSFPVKVIAKSLVIFLCLSILLPVIWSGRNYRKYGYPMVATRGGLVLLAHTYLVDWGLKDALKWSVFQLSDSIGNSVFPRDAKRMDRLSGEPNAKAIEFFSIHGEAGYSQSEVSALSEWFRLLKSHPFRYVLFYSLNSLNHVLFEGIYPDLYPKHKTALIKYIYITSAIILHVFYSIFIWLIIILGSLKFIFNTGINALKELKIKYAIITFSLGYFIFFAYHFNTVTRYFYPFYFNVYLLFALSWNYLFRKDNEADL